jgi:NAD(P)-dependent dehydrogenase (short-subunit alcohol dehydrogenase family)
MSRIAVVTGGASGMGRTVCEQLARRGHRVAVLDINEAAAKTTADSLRTGGADAIACAVDVADRTTVDDAIEAVRRDLGPVEILVTCAAITRWEAFDEISLQSWNEVLAINLTGTFNCAQAVLPDMVAAGWGRIITVTSSSYQVPTALHSHYIASKGAVIGLTRALAVELAPQGVTVNTISPHLIDTPMLRQALDAVGKSWDDLRPSQAPVGRFGTGDDIAAACLFLCSDEAGYFTGQLLGVNGGAIA